MSEAESADLAEAASPEVYAAVAEAMRQAGARDSRLGADAVVGRSGGVTGAAQRSGPRETERRNPPNVPSTSRVIREIV